MSIDQKFKERLYQVAIAVSLSAATFSFGFVIDTRTELATIQKELLNDDSSQKTAEEVLRNWSQMSNRVEPIERQLKRIWENYNKALEQKEAATERVAKLEAKLEYCCE